ncbi:MULTISPECIES: PepSY domain-containing protein [Halomonas]|uniref:PepSY domain-containing protein n=1 Tax=Halomonas TaxID=2745 RepID=UPI0002D325EB|nr:PepSY domain-containing protein [Halomonas smyrnensis]
MNTFSRWRRPRRLAGALAASLLVAALGGPMIGAQGDDDEQWQALHEAVHSGRIVPLTEVLDWLEARYRGQVLEIELDHEDGERRYEIEMLGPQGQVVEFEFDAEDGRLMEIEGVNIEGMRRQ